MDRSTSGGLAVLNSVQTKQCEYRTGTKTSQGHSLLSPWGLIPQTPDLGASALEDYKRYCLVDFIWGIYPCYKGKQPNKFAKHSIMVLGSYVWFYTLKNLFFKEWTWTRSVKMSRNQQKNSCFIIKIDQILYNYACAQCLLTTCAFVAGRYHTCMV